MAKRKRENSSDPAAEPQPITRETSASVTDFVRNGKSPYSVHNDTFFATYKVKESHAESRGEAYRLMLAWDCDRLLGSFDLGLSNGVLPVERCAHSPPSNLQL
ncbi:uncharacterized protein CIMG_03971 [Coccidioides immitis RS]|uniref:Uncharacterized protein n=6 Tax=Coccidioides TaxID=5500 RepID=J3KCI2_COCIM|nr:uncharacterized protein CIMG_03971 [Coccidioides immitis RS]EFW20129.1 conserved hypothetical protein [Coccidioides posadasii str. Silveira]KMM73305.1 hypothetical protein CPAG_09594 [Coccidioides posadasii RMSCC 3488]KMP08224.1 hypothetical protein CIRG_07905 [Coccidioides immitis RMSCC 2394]KMU79498.1 hypothetical protein CISG_01916 [Coccidioides immitis RMSCC 3703]KMU89932.1 hypothetical protein CIHG_07615 [Coccidioides immitis H538.4]